MLFESKFLAINKGYFLFDYLWKLPFFERTLIQKNEKIWKCWKNGIWKKIFNFERTLFDQMTPSRLVCLCQSWTMNKARLLLILVMMQIKEARIFVTLLFFIPVYLEISKCLRQKIGLYQIIRRGSGVCHQTKQLGC